MNEQERTGFLEAMAKAVDLMKNAHAALQAAQLRCHGSLYDHVAPIANRIYESRITAEWLQQVALGRLSLEGPEQPHARQTPDRRQALDRRIAGIRKELMSLKAERQKI